MSVCIIPARGGSKRIPRKNIREFCGKPMISWSIEAARESGCFTRIVISTDDAEISEVARAHGAEVPFDRPSELADDQAATVPVIAHAVEELGLSAETPVCCLYATAPFVSVNDLRETLGLLQSSPDSFILPIATFAFPIQRALRRDSSGYIQMMNPEMALSRSQDLEEAWHDAGQFYWGLAGLWRPDRSIFHPAAIGYPIPRSRVQDIDTLEDWDCAERMHRTNFGNPGAES